MRPTLPNHRQQPPCSRREFLTALLAAPALAGCATPAAARTRWQVGCYTRPWDRHDYRTALDAIAEAGFRYAGIMTARGASWVMITAETSPERAAEIGAALKQRRLRAVSVYGDYRPTPTVADNVKALERLIMHCVACGSPDLLLGGVGEAGLQGPYYDAIREVSAVAAAHGVRLTIKPHGDRIATGPQCRRVIEDVARPNFCLWYDPGNILYYSDGALDPVSDAATVDGLVVGMSIKDFLPPKSVDVTPGRGRVDFPAVVARLRQGGFTGGPLVVECVSRPDPQDVKAITAEARRAREFVERLVAA
jgi:sugar phosphate isomerase/epimerase